MKWAMHVKEELCTVIVVAKCKLCVVWMYNFTKQSLGTLHASVFGFMQLQSRQEEEEEEKEEVERLEEVEVVEMR